MLQLLTSRACSVSLARCKRDCLSNIERRQQRGASRSGEAEVEWIATAYQHRVQRCPGPLQDR